MCQIFNSVNQHFPSHQHMLQNYTGVKESFKVQDTPGNFNKKSTDIDSTLHLISQKLPLVEFYLSTKLPEKAIKILLLFQLSNRGIQT